MEEANRDGRIVEFRPSGGGVYTTWDLGNNANTSVVYWEVNGPQRRVIDADNGSPNGTDGASSSHDVQGIQLRRALPPA